MNQSVKLGGEGSSTHRQIMQHPIVSGRDTDSLLSLKSPFDDNKPSRVNSMPRASENMISSPYNQYRTSKNSPSAILVDGVLGGSAKTRNNIMNS